MNYVVTAGIPLALAYAGLAYTQFEHAAKLDALLMVAGFAVLMLLLVCLAIPIIFSVPITPESGEYTFDSINKAANWLKIGFTALIIYMLVSAAVLRATAYIKYDDTEALTDWWWNPGRTIEKYNARK